MSSILNGLTRPAATREATNPRHTPIAVQNRVRVQVVGPGGVVKHDRWKLGNVMCTYGLSRLVSMLAGGALNCSDWIGGIRVGTGNTAAASTDNQLVASTGSRDLTDAGDVVEQGARTLRCTASFASNNPAGSYSGREVGIFASSAVTTGLVARMDLTGADSFAKGNSDTVNITYDMVFITA